ncbi:GNAT family N-acetyltransferase [Mycolicibacterium komossense]|uniref:GNAT family N-acetyltransferase n=1 Tax=Mycolicibacterium komossense TaxID=1779 RepID=A0ABT3CGM0_9MYCO|nr:GNAT family N-acetyltransferase [Mycolicibacterium komossense]
MRARRFERSDWAWVQRWFEDETVNSALGPLDTEWLDHVTSDHDGVQLVIEQSDGTAVALVGVAWDRSGHTHGITDIAVDPARRRCRIGSAALRAAINWPHHPKTGGWIAFVNPENTAALAFFSALNWTADGIDDDMHRFHLTRTATTTP